MDDLNEIVVGYYSLAGAVVRTAIDDYKNLRFRSTKDSGLQKFARKMCFEDAKDFLFSDRLEDYLIKFGLENIVNADKIRKIAKGE